MHARAQRAAVRGTSVHVGKGGGPRGCFVGCALESAPTRFTTFRGILGWPHLSSGTLRGGPKGTRGCEGQRGLTGMALPLEFLPGLPCKRRWRQ